MNVKAIYKSNFCLLLLATSITLKLELIATTWDFILFEILVIIINDKIK